MKRPKGVTRRQAERRRDEGIARAEEAVGEEWRADARADLAAYLRTHAHFFIDDFWNWSALAPKKAIGGIIFKASLDGWMKKNGEARPSVRSNMALKPVWESLVYEEDS